MNKDIYEYILGFCEDLTIYNAVLANGKIYKNREEVYERIMKRKYPGSEKWKKEEDSWEKHFVSIGNFVAILKRRFDIPYFEGLNPEKFYLSVRDRTDRDVYILAMHEAISKDNLDMVKFFVKSIGNMNNICSGCISLAIRVNSLKMVKYFIENFSHDGQINYLAIDAVALNRIEILNYLLEQGADNFDMFLLQAAYASNFPLVKLMVAKGATSFLSALEHVTDPEIEKYLRIFL